MQSQMLKSNAKGELTESQKEPKFSKQATFLSDFTPKKSSDQGVNPGKVKSMKGNLALAKSIRQLTVKSRQESQDHDEFNSD